MAVANATAGLSDVRLWDIAQRIGRMASLVKAGFDIDEDQLDEEDRKFLKYAHQLVKGVVDLEPFASNVIDARQRFVRKSEAVISGT